MSFAWVLCSCIWTRTSQICGSQKSLIPWYRSIIQTEKSYPEKDRTSTADPTLTDLSTLFPEYREKMPQPGYWANYCGGIWASGALYPRAMSSAVFGDRALWYLLFLLSGHTNLASWVPPSFPHLITSPKLTFDYHQEQHLQCIDSKGT